ncbi:AEC family transporter [Leucobacter sp. CSA1]|uniref:AEC family transporter n=1 Tax=Leucobacter chromiisoli TaxID=2796471 RepID=A0A934Q2U5_9MICO|nr:AEC family transporter [Leucobacter chromiisoli]MBK0417510.1 AEC family transporter [Leucobacter chromiisoli]
MMGVLQGFTLILGIIGAGYLAALCGVVKGEQRLVLNRVAFYVATPALLFAVLHDSDPGVLLSPVILVTSLAAVLSAAIYVTASRLWFRRDAASTTLGAAGAGYVNSNNLGLPVAVYILGDAAYVAPLMLVQLVVFAPVILAILEATRGNQRGAVVALGRAASNPIIIASLAGFAVALLGSPVPELVLGPIEMLGSAAIPMVLLSFGISLRGQRALERGTGRAAVFAASGIKVLGMPLIAWLLARAGGLDPHETFVATIIAALPTAQNVFNYAATYQRAELMVRDTVFLTTFASLPVIAGIAWLLSA